MASNAPRLDPPSVRIIRAAAAYVRSHTAACALAAGVAAAALWLAGGVYAVGVQESAVLLRFGRLVDDNIVSGLHLRLPSGVDAVTKVRTGEVRRIEIAGDVNKEIALMTGDENLIDAVAVVQYKITRLADYLYGAEKPEDLLKLSVRAAMVDSVARMHVDDVLTTGKAQIQNDVRKAAQEMLNGYRAGVTLMAVNLQSVTPPKGAAEAFLKVSDAKAEAARAINTAQSNREKSINLARGEAGKRLQEASATASARTQQAEGAAERFESVLAEKKITPKLTVTALYMDTIAKVLARAKLVLLAPGQKPRVDVNLIEKKTEEK
jgi:membrane protease subunit HflK